MAAKSTDKAHEPNSEQGATPTEGQPDDATVDGQPSDAQPVEMESAKRGHVYVTYEGHAAVANIQTDAGEIQLRPGVPVLVPKNVADDLLTTPFEQFTVAEEVPAAALQGEE